MGRGVEYLQLEEYLSACVDEMPFDVWRNTQRQPVTLAIAEGFEDRARGVLERWRGSGITVDRVFLGRYSGGTLRREKRHQFERLASELCPRGLEVLENHDDGRWIADAAALQTGQQLVLDITGLSRRGLFGALDVLSSTRTTAALAYSEAAVYKPTRADWEGLVASVQDVPDSDIALSERLEEIAWLHSGNHAVELVDRHEGYDAPGAPLTLVAFLPFKCGRLAAILGWADYSNYVFIAGVPRLDENAWRREALYRINSQLVKGRRVLDLSTFGFKSCLRGLADLVLGENPLLFSGNVHIAPLGSKLQTIAVWILSRTVPAVSVVTSTPTDYHPDAFSDGVGATWIIPWNLPSAGL